jgi:hypothetical protein
MKPTDLPEVPKQKVATGAMREVSDGICIATGPMMRRILREELDRRI